MSRIDGWHDNEAFDQLRGHVLASVELTDDKSEMVFTTAEGKRFALFHSQDCCESVSVEDVVGDLADLIGEPLLEAEEASSEEDPAGYKAESEYRESFTWTFYKLATRKGAVTIRWLGESNGYYSESVTFCALPDSTPVTGNEVKP